MATAKLLSKTLKFFPTIAEFETNYNVALEQDRIANPQAALTTSTEPDAPPEVRDRYLGEIREVVAKKKAEYVEAIAEPDRTKPRATSSLRESLAVVGISLADCHLDDE